MPRAQNGGKGLLVSENKGKAGGAAAKRVKKPKQANWAGVKKSRKKRYSDYEEAYKP